MFKGLQWKFLLIIAVLIFVFLQIFPVPSLKDWLEPGVWNNYFKSLNIVNRFPETINLGLDLQGGMYLVIEVDTERLRKEIGDENKEELEKKIEDAVDKAFIVLQRRIDEFGVAEPSIVKSGERIIIQLPGVKDRERAINLVGTTASLEFRMVHSDNDRILTSIVDEKGNLLPGQSPPPGFEILYENPRNQDGTYQLDASGQRIRRPHIVSERVELGGNDLNDAYVAFNPQTNRPYIQLIFNFQATRTFGDLTDRYKPVNEVYRHLAIILDNNVVMAPRIMGRIDNGRPIIEGGFSLNEAQDVAITLRAGALPVPIDIVQEQSVGPTLGQDSVKRGTRAAAIGLIAIIVFMIYKYSFTAGLFADIALILNLIIVLGALAFLEATLTLPGIAGIILTIGIAVDANTIVFERIKEELRSGKTVKNSIDQGYDRALVAILDANLTTILTSIVLYQFGTGPIRGFAVTLSIGIISSMFTALFCTKVFFKLLTAGKKMEKIGIFSLGSSYAKKVAVKDDKVYDFISKKKIGFAISITLLVIGFFALIFNKGLNYGIDFTGGSSVIINFNKPIMDEDLRELRILFEENEIEGDLQTFQDIDSRYSSRIILKTVITDEDIHDAERINVADKVEKLLLSNFDDKSIEDVEGKYNFNIDYSREDLRNIFINIVADIIYNKFDKLRQERITDLSQIENIIKEYGLDLSLFEENYVTERTALTETRQNINEISEVDFKRFVTSLLESNSIEIDRKVIWIEEIKKAEDGIVSNWNEIYKLNFSEDFKSAFAETFYLSSFIIESVDEIGPSIGRDYKKNTVYSIIWALMLIVIYISWRFELKFGVGAVVALVHDVFITVAIFAFFQIEFTNQIVAAILTIIGYSLNDTIVVYDRIRENIKTLRSKSFTDILNISLSQTLSRTIITSLTTLLAVVSLYIFGGRVIRDFSLTLIIGVIVGTFSSIYVAVPVLLFWKSKNKKKLR